MNKKLTMKELIDTIDWVAIEMDKVGGAYFLGENEVAVAFRKGQKKTKVDKVTIRVGKGLMKTLGWKFKDEICIFHHPDDYLAFRLIKTDAGKGYRLKSENNSPHGKIDFTWKFEEFALRLRRMAPVECFTPRDQYLIFRVNGFTES